MADESSLGSRLTTARQRVRSLVEPLLEIRSARFDQAFVLVILATVGYQLLAARRFSFEGRLFVYVIGVPTFVMAALVLLSQLSPRVAEVMGELSTDVLGMGDQVGSILDGTTDLDPETARLRVLRTSAWIFVATLIIALFGFVPSILAFMVAFYLVETDLGPWRSVGYAIVIWIGILIVFEVLLNTRFYGGFFDVMSYVPFQF